MTYYKQGTHETTLPKTYSYSFTKGSSVSRSGYISLSYDPCENISSITYDGSTTAYTYDSLGRLEKEVNGQLGHTYTFTYDNNGNIMTKKVDNTTITYAYNGDKLTSYNGQSCVYDAIGNPTTYRGKTATWTRGRKLTAYDGNTFSYDATGRRLTKNSIRFYYDSEGNLLKQSNGLEFFYGADGLAAIKYSGNTYLCRKDMLGNILALLDSSGNIVVQYKYDAWGNHTVTDANGNAISDANHIGNLNPFRYRGYYFDCETGFYFLQSRYYDPEVGRFLNMDSIEYANQNFINGINLYAYCGNSPVVITDPTGTNWWDDFCSRVVNGVKTAWNATTNWVSNTWNDITSWAKNTFGFSVQYSDSFALQSNYYIFASTESGVGYNKSFGNGKPVNFYVTLPKNWWEFWDFSFGVDININGYGAGLGLGGETSLTIHTGSNSIDIFANALGRLGFRNAYRDEHGNYVYQQFTLNFPEIGAAVLAVYATFQTAGAALPAISAAFSQLYFYMQYVFA